MRSLSPMPSLLTMRSRPTVRLLLATALLFGSISWPALARIDSPQNRVEFPEPAGYWSFDLCEGSTTYDAAVDPHHATLKNGASCSSTGQFGSSGYFDGSNDRVEIAANSAFDVTNQVTISAWVRPSSVSGLRTIVNRWYFRDAWGLFIQDGQFKFSIATPGGSWGTVRDVGASATANRWTHLAGVYDGNQMRLYLDGVLKATRNITVGSTTIQSTNRPIVIGNHPSWNAYRGHIDEVKLYTEALSPAQVTALATQPGSLGNRGVHLFPSPWACPEPHGDCNNAIVDEFRRDLDRINTIGNLNSIKTSIFSHPGAPWWIGHQKDKLTWLKSAVGNHVTWIIRAWPVEGQDCSPGSSTNYYQCGYDFAASLAETFDHIKHGLRLQNVYIEVANEPNIAEETLFYHPNHGINLGRYNDFFRGFYFGQRSAGYDFPQVYAGLSPQCDASSCGTDLWYTNPHVRSHIQNYAAKIGVHVYWGSTNANAWNGRLSETGGLYYRRVKNQLAGAISARGIQVTEFNFNRQIENHSTATQASEFCKWWRTAGSDAAAGYWIEQTSLFVTATENDEWLGIYDITDDQLDDIRNCGQFSVSIDPIIDPGIDPIIDPVITPVIW